MSRSLRVDQAHIGTVKASARARFHTQRELSEELRIALATVSNFLNGKPVDRAIFEEICTKLSLHWKDIVAPLEEPPPQSEPMASMVDRPPTRQDWGEAPEVSTFYGRVDELATLEQWIKHDRCRLLAILGMGGMGKTALAVKLAEQVQDEFEYVMWRSLRNAPSVEEILINFLRFLSNDQETNLPDTTEALISQLVCHLRSERCLLILDNVESILREGDRAGQYREGYESYEQLFGIVGETLHQSCLLLTGREKPKGLTYREGHMAPIRSLQLSGLEAEAGQKVVQVQGILQGSIEEWKTLVNHYAGNPLALKIVAPAIQDFFEGSLAQFLQFLQQGTLVFDDIRDLLERQFNRLSELEKEVMYWLAINREPVSLSDLQLDFVHAVVVGELLETLASLQRRSLIEKTIEGFTQQPVVMEYVTAHFVNQCCQEITQQSLYLLRRHALIKAQAKNYIRDSQIHLILKPFLEQLLIALSGQVEIEFYFNQLLNLLRLKPATHTGYAAGNILNALVQLQVDLTQHDFSQLAIAQAYLPNTTLHYASFAQSQFDRCVFTETMHSIVSIAFSSNGQFLATGESDGSLRLWCTKDYRQLATLRGHTEWVNAVTFSPDGQFLASSSYNHTVQLWDVATGQCLVTFKDHTGWVRTVAFTPDGRYLVSISDDQTIKVWDIQSKQCSITIQGHTHVIWCLSLSSCGKYLATGSYDHTVKVWDIQTGQCLHTLIGHTGRVRIVAFTPDGQTIISTSIDQTIKTWDFQTGECLNTVRGNFGQLDSYVFNLERTVLIAGSSDKALKFWDVRTGTCLKTFQETGNILAIACNSTGTVCATGGDNQSIRLWDVETGRNFRTLQGYRDGVSSIALIPASNHLVSGHHERILRLWDLQTGACHRTFQGHTGRIWSVACHPEKPMLASSGSDRTIRLWDIETGSCLQVLKDHTHWVWYVTFSPDGKFLISGDGDNLIKLWDTDTWKCLRTLRGHRGAVWCLDVNHDGKTLVASSQDQVVKLWDMDHEKCIATLTNSTYKFWLAFFSPDGQTIACGGFDGTIGLWNTRLGQYSHILKGHTQSICYVTFSPDGQRLASSSIDQTIRIWNVATGDCLNLLQGHTGAVKVIKFSADGQTLFSSSEDGSIKFWDMKVGTCLRTLQAPRPYEGMNITGVAGLTKAQKDTLKALGAIALD